MNESWYINEQYGQISYSLKWQYLFVKIIHACFINVRVHYRTPSILITKGLDDFVAIFNLVTDRLIIISLCQSRDRHFDVRRRRGNKVSQVHDLFSDNTWRMVFQIISTDMKNLCRLSLEGRLQECFVSLILAPGKLRTVTLRFVAWINRSLRRPLTKSPIMTVVSLRVGVGVGDSSDGDSLKLQLHLHLRSDLILFFPLLFYSLSIRSGSFFLFS